MNTEDFMNELDKMETDLNWFSATLISTSFCKWYSDCTGNWSMGHDYRFGICNVWSVQFN